MNANPSKKSTATVTSEPQELEHQIRLRAQELYEARGREDGHDSRRRRFTSARQSRLSANRSWCWRRSRSTSRTRQRGKN